MIRSKKLRQSAKLQACTLNIVGVCNYLPETTVLAHIPDQYKGIGFKSSDISSCFACSSCHDAIDGRVIVDEFEDNAEFYLFRAWRRTIERWFDMGVINVA